MAVLATTGPSATELRSLFRRIVQAGLRSSRSMPVISGPEAVGPRFEIVYAQMTSNPRHSLPPRLMAHQPTRFATAQESKPSPSPGIRITQFELLQRMALDPWNNASDEPARLAHLNHRNDRAVLLQGSEGPAQVVELLCHGTLHRVASSDDGDISPPSAP